VPGGPPLPPAPIALTTARRIDPELTAKVALGRWRVYEVPISYHGRTYAEGKKVTWKDGVQALYCIGRFGLLGCLQRLDAGGPGLPATRPLPSTSGASPRTSRRACAGSARADRRGAVPHA
jgi:hypothetical protein